MLNDVYLSGKKHDLSAFSVDLSQPADFEIKTQNKQVQVFINEQEAFSLGYIETMGRLVGIRFKFRGLSDVQSVDLFDQKGKGLSCHLNNRQVFSVPSTTEKGL